MDFRDMLNVYRPGAVLWCVLAAMVIAIGSGCSSDAENGSPSTEALSADRIEELRAPITAFCGGCHDTPDPSTFPRDAWYKEVEQGYRFYHDSQRKDLHPPPMSDVVTWYRSQAPTTLQLHHPEASASPVRFRRERLPLLRPNVAGVSGIANLLWLPPQGSSAGGLFFCDMRYNEIGRVDVDNSELTDTIIAEGIGPARMVPTDLDRDGNTDFLVAELGSFTPEDHDRGKVVWLLPTTRGPWLRKELLTGIGRVADIQPSDFDGDGDLDLVVAEFGWRKTGHIRLLTQVAFTEGSPVFESTVIDERHGVIHVPVVDLDQDGDQDFIALISQEHEAIDAFLNRGDGTFERQVIHFTGDPSYGSSGIQLVDLDQDGDIDVLFTNGDTLDTKYLKPYHCVQWLENQGDFPFQYHYLTPLPGVSRALAGDLDGDGDLDIAATAWIPPDALHSEPDANFDVLIWLEQTSAGQFTRHSLVQARDNGYMALELGDVDADQDLDVVGGVFGRPFPDTPTRLDVFRNEGPASVSTVTAAEMD